MSTAYNCWNTKSGEEPLLKESFAQAVDKLGTGGHLMVHLMSPAHHLRHVFTMRSAYKAKAVPRVTQKKNIREWGRNSSLSPAITQLETVAR